ncbi:MAG: leucine-rich repeat domain-containing protein [Eubacteriales bacterium]|nr:leucine-rich repeat domain-containing protein [Eubacteriales bacterium]
MKRKAFIAVLILSLCMGGNASVFAAGEFTDMQEVPGTETPEKETLEIGDPESEVPELEAPAEEDSFFSDGETLTGDTIPPDLSADGESIEKDGIIEQNGLTYQYDAETDSYIVIKGSGQQVVRISDEINGKVISAIAPKAFYHDDAVTKVYIGGEYVEKYLEIGESAFEGCKNLEEIYAVGAKKVGVKAFYGCEKLNTLTLDFNAYVSSASFQECPRLQSLVYAECLTGDTDAFDPDNKIIAYTEAGGLSLKKFNIIYVCQQEDQEGSNYVEKGNLEYFNDTAASCKTDASGKIAVSVQPHEKILVDKIGRKCFYECTGVTEIIIPSGVKTIETKAFYGCTGLEKVQIPESVTSIADDAFAEAENAVIYAKKGSYAADYAETHGIELVTDGEKELSSPAAPKLTAKGNTVTAVLPLGTDGAEGYEFVIGGKSCYKDINLLKKISTDSLKAEFKYIKKGTHYAYARAYKTVNGEKIYSPWSVRSSVKVQSLTPSTPKITKASVSGKTVKVTYTKASYAAGYDVVLGKAVNTTAYGEKRPVQYGKMVKKATKGSTVTVTFKNVPKGTYYAGLHAYSRTGANNTKVFSPWSNIKSVKVK